MKNNQFVLGLLGGVAIGAVIGILFAPEKGSKTRKKMKLKCEDYAGELKQKFDSFSDTVTHKFSDLERKTKDFVTKSKE
ncbi:MAG: YtxH domain-containing protein [Flavobacterium sp.]|jgi:gas vesicle protein|nr:YtxH domain-containing protein [Flavobacterium sp.]